LTAAAFKCCQNRRRYFFVAYKNDRNFNVCAPQLDEYRTVTRDVIEKYEGLKTTEFGKGESYTDDSSRRLNVNEMVVVPHLDHGWSLNSFARHHTDMLPEKYKRIWDYRASEMPFSMHTIYRLPYDTFAPTMTSGCGKLIHPKFHRACTIRELASMMGNDFTPVGPDPFGQIAKGICPAVGTWLAEQARMYLDDEWGSDDFASKYDAKLGMFVDNDEARRSEHEKVFKMTDFRPYNDRFYEQWVKKIPKRQSA
jgi:site-specific DNA-cytosine methylase